MKRQFVKVALVCSLFFFSACHKSEDNIGNNNNNTDLTNGSWRVTLFTDSGNDETADFSGYSFTFNSDGTLNAVKSAVTKTGSWSKGSKFNIDLGVKSDSNKPLGELTDDWHILSISSNEIKLGDDNPASGEALTFSKN
jgi:hypothetical protein